MENAPAAQRRAEKSVDMKKKLFGLLSVALSFCFLVSGCQRISDQASGILDAKCNEFIDYFNEIALYPDYTAGEVITRWERPMHVKIEGDYTEEDYAALTNLIGKLNSIDGMPEISIEDEHYNCYIDFSPQKLLESIHFFGKGNWWTSYIDSYKGNIDFSHIGIATDVSTQEQRNYMILLSMINTLGLRCSSDKYPDSLFYPKWNDVQSLSDMDLELVRMLYSPSLHAGMNEEEAREALLPMVRAKFIDDYLG